MHADRHIVFQDASAKMLYQVCIISSIRGWAHGHFNSCQEILFSLPSLKPDPTFDLLEKHESK